MRVVLAILLLAVPVVADHPGSVPAFGNHPDGVVHNVFTVDETFAAYAADHPDLVERFTLGTSLNGLPLHGIVITDKASDLPKAKVYIDGGHHGNEYLGVEIIMVYLQEVIGDPGLRERLATLELHVVPILNPEGNLGDRRYNGRMVDLNRNYDFGWSGNCLVGGVCLNGAAPHSEPEVAANVAYVTALSPDLWISTHTGIQTLYWPQGNPDVPGDPFVPFAPDIGVFETLEVGFEAATNGRIDAYGGPAAALGSAEDYGYGVLGIPSFVYEVHNDQNLPAYGEPMSEVLRDQLAGMHFLVDHALHMGASVVLESGPGGPRLANLGWGPARNVTVQSADGVEVLAEILPGASVPLEAQGAIRWSYPALLIETSRVRSHEAVVPGAETSDAQQSVPALPAAYVVIGLAALALSRRR